MEIDVVIKSNYMDLKNLLFEGSERVELPRNAVISFKDADADLSGFDTQVIIEIAVEANSTEAIEPVSGYLYDRMKDLDNIEININDKEVGLAEEDIKRGLMKAYYKN